MRHVQARIDKVWTDSMGNGTAELPHGYCLTLQKRIRQCVFHRPQLYAFVGCATTGIVLVRNSSHRLGKPGYGGEQKDWFETTEPIPSLSDAALTMPPKKWSVNGRGRQPKRCS